MTTITIPTLDVSARPTRLEVALWAAAAFVQHAVAARVLRRAGRSIVRSAATAHADATRAHVLAHLASHPGF
ncbi:MULTISPECIES: hypothetical protein [Microbacterium]|jgi:hypothetical protein|uniref:Uncharacterized protein n=1 Tax=Microbacterium oleivorans TaxID=273677 RepID=A0A031FZC7_9MICO|nr:hypothetical protein [Microbacterium oleivorans]EZP29576.1 hypothetical protein BW34_00192 [Microbacterium oleivorans]THE08897.1 hypothetical protein E1I21_00140 [Microbacterium oleivorans]